MVNSKKFKLFLVDNNAETISLYRNYFANNVSLKGLWDGEIEDASDGQLAIDKISEYVKSSNYPVLVVADGYMEPNCDGNTIRDTSRLFGGLWLIDRLKGNPDLTGRVSIILVSFYDDQLTPFLNGDKGEIFEWINGKDFRFVHKPYPHSQEVASENESSRFWKRHSLQEDLYRETYEVVCKIVEENAISSHLTSKVQGQTPAQSREDSPKSEIIYKSEAFEEIHKLIVKCAPSDASVLITGETGTGKELIAKAICIGSPRRQMPWKAVNCGAIPENLIESELFGYEKGAFTGADKERVGLLEFVNGGTIFLDEIGELSPEQQVALLRVLQEGTVRRVGSNTDRNTNVRVIAATNSDLREKIKSGGFRKDLFYRLAVVEIHVPPLRERREDIPLLIDYFLNKYGSDPDKEVTFDSHAFRVLTDEYDWPGNVRELENAINRMVIMAEPFIPITRDDLVHWRVLPDPGGKNNTYLRNGEEPINLKESQREHSLQVLKSKDHDVSKAALALGTSKSTLYNWLKKWGIDRFGNSKKV